MRPQLSESPDVRALFSRIDWHVIPIPLIGYMIAYLDRVNIGYAQLQMKQTLPFDEAVYGLGAGIFFAGYLLFEVPSNLLLEKIGARKTLLRVMLLWGIAASAMMFVSTPLQFYVVRFLLGVFEAGFFPGVILYFTYWYPAARRGRVIAIFMSATTIVSVMAGPLCGAILKYLDGFSGLHGWQWLFLVQGSPAIVLGLLLYLLLDDKPAHAAWLSHDEKQLLADSLSNEKGIKGEHAGSFGQVLRDPKVYLLGLANFFMLGAAYTIIFWKPTLIQSWGVKDVLLIGVYAAIPNAVGAISMILIGRHSDKWHERRWHYAACMLIAAFGLFLTTLIQGNVIGSVMALSIAVVGMASASPLFIALISEYLSAGAVAGGLAFVNTLGVLGPAVSPSINGLILRSTGDNIYSMYFVMVLYILSGALLLLATRRSASVAAVPAPA